MLPEWPFFPLLTDLYSNTPLPFVLFAVLLLWLSMKGSWLDCGQSWPSVFYLGSQLDRDQLKILEKAVTAQSVSLSGVACFSLNPLFCFSVWLRSRWLSAYS